METGKQPININITSATIIKTILIFVLLYFLYLIKEILILFFVALVFSSALDPFVDWFSKRKIPRSLSMVIIYLVIFSVLGGTLFAIVPPILSEVNDLSNNFPQYYSQLAEKINILKDYSLKFGILDNLKSSVSFFGDYLSNTASGIFFTVANIFGGIFSFALILVLTFYLVVEENAMKKLVWSIAPAKHQPYLMQLINRMQLKMGYWLRGQLILALVLAALAYLGMLILGVKYALVLALLVGLLSFIPYMGPILGAIPAVFIAFTQSAWLSLFTIILFYIIHFIEGNFLQPKIMQKAIGINPIVSIVALLAGFKLAGLIGAILAVPVVTAAGVFAKDVFDAKTGGREDV